MINRHTNNKEQRKDNIIYNKMISIALIIVVLIFVLLFFFYPQFFRSLAFKASRIKNTFSYYALQERPHFYYLEVEKNGNDIRVGKDESLEVTYRDEFAVKSVVSDDLTGKYTTVKVEGLSKGDNDLGILLRGVDLVNKIIKDNIVIDKSGIVSDYKILINFRDETIAAVGLKVVITPQDWFRFAKDSSNVKEQIEYLKKAIVLNKNDISMRKILAGVYFTAGQVG